MQRIVDDPDQSPRFGMHVVHGLTDKVNHRRVKVYYLYVFRDSRSVFCAQPLPHTEARARESERERGSIQTTPQRTDTHKVMLK